MAQVIERLPNIQKDLVSIPNTGKKKVEKTEWWSRNVVEEGGKGNV
jgi:hypothetical protein